MALNEFDLATLLEVRRKQESIQRFWINFFTRQINFETKFIDFERVSKSYRKLAPFVAPNVQGRVISTEGSNLERFAPAYVKIKTVIDSNKVIARQVGEVPYQPMSNEQRRNAVVAEEIREHKSRIDNREEWLAARAIIDGAVTIEGEDYPAATVNFNRDPSLTTTLVGAAKWDVSTGKPLQTIRDLRSIAQRKSGKVIRNVYFGRGAWDLFVTRLDLDNPATGNLLDTTFRGSDTNISRIIDGFEGVEYVGTVAGREGQGAINCFVYSGFYEDEAGNEVEFMHTNQIVGVGEVDGVRCYGAIHDKKAGYRALPVFMKSWENEDPSVEYILSQSAPLMVPAEPDASFSARVA